MNVAELQKLVDENYTEVFGHTPLTERLADIDGEARELVRFVDIRNLREEAGDLLTSTLQLINECGFDAEELVQENIEKIRKRQAQYQALGRKYKVAILGGAFNPPTKAHIAVAKYVLDTSRMFDEVWLMPCYGHMYGKEMVPAEDRLEMCRIATRDDGRIKVSDYEIKHQLAGETYYLARRMFNDPEITDHYDVSFIIGLDNALTFDKWVNYEHLEKMARFVIVPRDGIEDDPRITWFRKPPHIWIPFDDRGRGIMPGLACSSTQVRHLISLASQRNGSFVDETLKLVDEQVLDYVLKRDFYRKENADV